LEHLPDLDLALPEGDTARPLDRLLPGPDLEHPEPRHQLLRLREGAVDHRGLAALEADPHAPRARVQPLTRQQHARLDQLLVVAGHLGQLLLRGHHAGLAFRRRLDEYHEPHDVPPWVGIGTGSVPASPIRRTSGEEIDRGGDRWSVVSCRWSAFPEGGWLDAEGAEVDVALAAVVDFVVEGVLDEPTDGRGVGAEGGHGLFEAVERDVGPELVDARGRLVPE